MERRNFINHASTVFSGSKAVGAKDEAQEDENTARYIEDRLGLQLLYDGTLDTAQASAF